VRYHPDPRIRSDERQLIRFIDYFFLRPIELLEWWLALRYLLDSVNYVKMSKSGSFMTYAGLFLGKYCYFI